MADSVKRWSENLSKFLTETAVSGKIPGIADALISGRTVSMGTAVVGTKGLGAIAPSPSRPADTARTQAITMVTWAGTIVNVILKLKSRVVNQFVGREKDLKIP